MRSPLARREQERFSGWIAGLGTASGHRLVVGTWPTSPFGMVTDVMVEDPGGHRTLYAPTPQLAAFLGAAYRFDDVQVVPCSARRSGPDWMVQAGPLQLSFTIGRRTSWAGCCGRSPPRWPEPPGGWACWTSPPAGCYPGSARAAGPATAAASGTVPRISIASSPPTPSSLAAPWARSGPSTHRLASASARCRADPPWSSSPPRSRLPVLRMAATLPKSA
jgi:hypothetical protein